jgi:hypothetical protein
VQRKKGALNPRAITEKATDVKLPMLCAMPWLLVGGCATRKACR